MKLKKRILLALGFISALASSTALAADAPYTSVLSGTVTDVVSVGQTVKEGDVLVQVDSLAGRRHMYEPPLLCRFHLRTSGIIYVCQ